MTQIRVTVNNPSPQRISATSQTRPAVRQIGITSDATLASGTVQSVAIATSEGLQQQGSPILISGTITITANTATTSQTGITRLQDSLLSLNVGQALTANMGNFIAMLLSGKVQNTVSILTGSGLSGGGDLTATRTLVANDASVSQNGILRITDSVNSTNTWGAATPNSVNTVQRTAVFANTLAGTVAIAAASIRSGTVNSVSISTSTGLVSSGSPITDTGTISISANDASTSVNGVVRLVDVLNSTNTFGAATPNTVNAINKIATMANVAALAIRSGTVNSVSIIAGSGLIQSGSPITDTGSITVTANDASTSVNGVVRLNDTLVSTNTGQALTANMGVFITSQLIGKVQNTTTISTTSPLSGGGDLTTNRTLSIQAASTTQNGEVRLNDTINSQNVGQAATANAVNAVQNNISTFAANISATVSVLRSGTVNSVSVIAGSGLVQSGSPVTGTGSITVTANDASISVNGVVRLNDTVTSSNNFQAATANVANILNRPFIGTYAALVPANTAGNGQFLLTAAGSWVAPQTIPGGSGGISGVVNVANGGTGYTSFVNGQILIGNSASSNLDRTNLSFGTGILITTAAGNIHIQANTFAGSTTQPGLVPANNAGNGQYLLSSSGTWVAPGSGGGGGSVTSVTVAGGNGLVSSGSPITVSGTITLAANDASTSVNGVVRLNDTVTSANIGQALTANMGKYLVDTLTLSNVSPIGGIRYFGGVNVYARQYTANDTIQPTLLDFSGSNTGNVTGDRTYVWRIQTLGTGVLFDSAIYYASVAGNQIPSPPYSHVKLNTVNTNQPEIVLTANTYRITSNHSTSYVFQVLTEEWPNDTVFPATLGPVAWTQTSGLTLFAAEAGGQPIIGQGAKVWNEMNQGPGSNLHADLLDTFHANAFANSVVANSRTVFTGSGLLGGGPLSGNLTITANDASTTVNGVVRLNDTINSQNTGQAATANAVNAVQNNISTFAANISATVSVIRSGTVNSVSITAGTGLVQSGSPITGTGTITVTANDASTSVNGVVRLEDTVTSTNTFGAATPRVVKFVYDAVLGLRSGTVNSVSVIAGSGLTQSGSPVTGTGSITVTANDASTSVNGVVRLNDTLASANVGQALTANMGNWISQQLVGKVQNTTTITTGSGLSGGGDLSTNRTITANDASVSVNGVVRLNDSLTSTNVGQAATANIVRYLDTYKVSNTRQIITGLGLRGGGDLSADRTLIANDASLSVNGIVVLNDTLNSTNNFQAATANAANTLARVFVGGIFPALVPPNVAAYGGGNGQYILTASGQWAPPSAAGGGVTSVSISTGIGLNQSGSPITGSGTITVTANDATTTQNGIVRLNDTINSQNTGQAATANAVNAVQNNITTFAANISATVSLLRSGTVNSVTIATGTGLVQSGSPITGTGTITVTANDASTSVNGVVRLEDTVTSTNTFGAATPRAVKQAYDAALVVRSGTVNSVSIIAGSGLSQAGSPVTGTGSITVTANDASTSANGVVRLNDSLTSQNTGQALTANMGFYLAQQQLGYVPNNRSVQAGSGLIATGAPLGALTSNIIISANDASVSVNGIVRLEDTVTSVNTFGAVTPRVAKFIYDALLGVRSATVNSVTIATGTGLVQSGSPITGTGTITVTANDASTSVNGVVRLEDTVTSVNTFGAVTPRVAKFIYDALLGVRSATVNSVTIATGTGLVQSGSPITGSGTITVTANDASTSVNGVVRLNDTLASANVGQALTANMGNWISQQLVGKVQNTTTITTGSGLAGGGDLSTNRTITANDASTSVNGVVRLEDTVTSINSFGASTPRVAKFIYDALLGVRSATVNSVSIVAGSGLSQTGSPITGTGSITVTANDASTSVNGVVRLNDTLASSNTGQALTANMGNWISQQFIGKVSNTRQIITGSGLSGGGDLTTDRTLVANDASTSVNGVVRLNDTSTSTNTGQALTANMGRYLDVYKVSNTRQIITGLGLRGGGDLSADRTLIANDASLSVNGIVVLNDTLNSSNNFQAATSNTVNVLARVFGGGNFPALVPPNVAAYGGGNGQYILTASGQWAPPSAAGGGVTSVTIATGVGLNQSGSPITSSGTITVTANDATTTQNGIVRLDDTVTSINAFGASTPRVAKFIYDAVLGLRSGTVNSVSIIAGSGLAQSGSPVTGTGSITVTANDASTSVNGVVRLNDTLTSQNTGQALTANMGFYIVQREAAFVSNTRQIITGSGLAGGGALTADRTIVANDASLSVNGVVRLEDSLTSVNTFTAATANIVRYLDVYKVSNTRTITTGLGLVGGGSLAADRTITANDASASVNGVLRIDDTVTSINAFGASTPRVAKFIYDALLGVRSATVNSVSIIAGSGLVQSGSPITGTGSITVTANDASTSVNGVVRLNDTLASANVGQALTANMGNWISQQLVGKVQNTTTITTGSGLLGGGDLSTNRTITANDASISVNGVVRLNDTLASQNTGQALTANMGFYLVQREAAFVQNTRQIITGSGLVGGGALTADRTITANDASTAVNGVVRLEDTVTSVNTFGAVTPRVAKFIYDAVLGVRSATVNSVTIATGTGLVQSGSPITGTGTITVTANDASTSVNGVVRLNDTLASANVGQALTANMGNWISQQFIGKVSNTRQVITGSGLRGGGDLTADRTLIANDATTTVNGIVVLNDTVTSSNNFQAATANVANILTRPFIGSYAALVPANTAASNPTGNGQYLLTAAGTWVAPGGGGGGSGTVTSVSIIAGTGLVQSGSPITVAGSITVTANDASTSVNGVVRLEDSLTSTNVGTAPTSNIVRYLDVYKVSNTRTITTGLGLVGGGSLVADRTITANDASASVNGVLRIDDTVTSINAFGASTPRVAKFIYDAVLGLRSGTVNSVSIIAGSGLVQSGSPITGTGSITVTANDASTSVNGVVRLEDTVTSINTFGAATPRVAKFIYDAVLGLRSGTVNSVSIIAGSGLVQSGSPVTGTGSITVTANDASVSVNGVVRLNDTLTSQNTGQALTANQGNALARIFSTANNGLVPVSPGGTTNFLRADGTWNAPAGGPGGGVSNTQDNLWSGNNNFYINDGNTTTITRAITIGHGNTGTVGAVVQAGFGTGIRFQLESNNLINVDAGYLDVLWANPNTQVYGANMSFKLSSGGAAPIEVMSLSNSGKLTIPSTMQALTVVATGFVFAGGNVNVAFSTVTQGLVTNGLKVRDQNGTEVVNGQILLGNSMSGFLEKGNLTQGTGLLVTPGMVSLTIAANDASVSVNGVVRLEDTVTSTNTFGAATPRAVKQAYDAALVVRSGTVNSVSIIAGSGLVQSGSPITGTGSITVTANDASTSVNGVVKLEDSLLSTNTFTAATSNIVRYLDVYKVSNTRQIITGQGLVGGGSLAADRTITANDASASVNGVLRIDDTVTSINAFGASTPRVAKFIYDAVLGVRSATVNSVSIIAGSGLVQSGSPITGTGSITVTANDASTSVNGVVRLNDTLASGNVGQALTANMGNWISQQFIGKVQNTTTISTTSPLAGGGDLTTNRTLSIQAAGLTQNGEVRLNDTLTSANVGQALTANMGRYLDAKSVPNTRQVLTAGGGVTGGGALTADITIIAANASLTVNGVVRLEDSLLSTNTGTAATANIVRYLDVYKVSNTRQIITGSGLAGGGALTADRTITANDASTSVNGVVRLQDTLSSQNVGQALTANMGFYIVQREATFVPNTRTITTGNGLLGGGDLTTNRTITANDASLSVNGVVRLEDSFLSRNTFTTVTANVANALARIFTLANSGLVPAPITSTGKLLRDDATWVTVSGTGTVTSVDANTGEGLANAGGPITGAGSISISLNVFSSTQKGGVPASGGGTTNFLRADGTWTAPAGGSGITSLTLLAPDTTMNVPAGALTGPGTMNVNVNSAVVVTRTVGLVPSAAFEANVDFGDAVLVDYRVLVLTTSDPVINIGNTNTGTIIYSTNGIGNVIVNLANNAAKGVHVTVIQGNTGNVYFANAVGSNLISRQGYTRTAGRWASITVTVIDDKPGTLAGNSVWYLAGDGM